MMETRVLMDDSNEIDEVVYEVDVFIAKALADAVYVFHYPTKHASAQLERTECLSAKVKPKQQKVELEFELDTHSQNYEKSRGEQMAINVDGMNPSGDTYFKSSKMDKYILSASKAGSSTDNYAVGYLRRGELHITPLHSIVELRPSFKYMDKMDSLLKKSLAAEEEDDQNEEAVAVVQRFENPNAAAKDKQMRQKSYQYLQQKSANEPWVNVEYHPCGSHKSKLEHENLICTQMYKDVASSAVSSKDYVKELVPESLRLSGYHSVRDEETAILVNKPTSDQIKHLLVNAHVMKFCTLLEKLPPDIEVASVERLVQQFAVLVQGCWVVKSELLYEEDSVSPISGFSGKNLINTRDYVVWLFTKSRHIIRREVLSAIYVPDPDLESMISQIAVKTDKGWEFKHPYDSEFVENHHSIEQSQEIKWNLRYKKLVKDLNLGMIDPDGQPPKPPCPVLSRPKQKRLSRSSLSEDGEESGTDASTSGAKDAKSKRLHSPKKRPLVSPSKLSSKSKPYHIATLDVSPTFLETSPSDEVKGELKDFLEELIRNHLIMTLSELKAAVSESNLSGLCNRSDFESLLEEALISCGAQKLKNKWPQNTTPEPLYAFTEFGNKLDRYRNILLELFSTTARARTNLFVKTVEDELREIITESDCRQIFEDYCVHKSGFYYLKGTISLDS